MESVPEEEREKALWAVSAVGTLRGKGGYSEQEIAAKAGFTSVEDMQQQFARWDLPDWLSGRAVGRRGRRKPGIGTGQYKELPAPSQAAALLREQIEVLLLATSGLHNTHGYQDGRFVGADVYEGTASLAREDWPEEAWRELCERNGQDPDSDHVFLMGPHLNEGS
jgi:hypothetical protein